MERGRPRRLDLCRAPASSPPAHPGDEGPSGKTLSALLVLDDSRKHSHPPNAAKAGEPLAVSAAGGGLRRSRPTAPTTPADQERRSRPRRSSSSMLHLRRWSCAALGDLLLDVVVRLDTAPTSAPTRRPNPPAGGQAANVAAWATELGAQGRLIAKRATDAAGELAARSRGARRRGAGPVVTGTTASSSRSSHRAAPDDGVRPRRGADAPPTSSR